MTMRRFLSLGVVLSVLLAGCGPAGEEDGAGEAGEDPQARAEIEQRLEEYLPVLATAYETGEIERLRPYAVERVMAQVEKRVSDLAGSGMVLEAELQGLVLEKVHAWGNDFAMVTALETWDLRHYSTGSRTLVSERLGTRNRVQYQLKKIGGRWMIFHRALEQEFDEPS